MCIVPFKTEDEVIGRANNVDYGLAASVWCQDMGVLTRVSQALQVRVCACLMSNATHTAHKIVGSILLWGIQYNLGKVTQH